MLIIKIPSSKDIDDKICNHSNSKFDQPISQAVRGVPIGLCKFQLEAFMELPQYELLFLLGIDRSKKRTASPAVALFPEQAKPIISRRFVAKI